MLLICLLDREGLFFWFFLPSVLQNEPGRGWPPSQQGREAHLRLITITPSIKDRLNLHCQMLPDNSLHSLEPDKLFSKKFFSVVKTWTCRLVPVMCLQFEDKPALNLYPFLLPSWVQQKNLVPNTSNHPYQTQPPQPRLIRPPHWLPVHSSTKSPPKIKHFSQALPPVCILGSSSEQPFYLKIMFFNLIRTPPWGKLGTAT